MKKYILIFPIFLFIICCKNSSDIENNEYLPYKLNGNTAIIESSFSRINKTYNEVIVEANNVVTQSADTIKLALNDNPKVNKVILRITSYCEDNYGKADPHTDEMTFNSNEVLELRKYNLGEDIAFQCELYRIKLNEYWNCCTPQNPSSLVY